MKFEGTQNQRTRERFPEKDMKEKKGNDTIAQLKEYICQTRWLIVLAGVTAFMAHGSVLFSQRFGFDTDAFMNGIHSFNQSGRYGLVWLARLLGLQWFNLYYAQVLAFFLMILAPISFGYLFYWMHGQKARLKPAQWILNTLFIVSPFWAGQIYFLNQSPQVLLACILIPVSLLLIEIAKVDLSHRWPCIFLAIALMNIIFACYQVLVMVYLAAAAVAFLLYCFKEERTVRQQLQWFGLHGGCFAAGFFSYMIVARLFYLSGGGYLTGQVSWGKGSVWEDLEQCARSIAHTFVNRPPYFSGSYGIYALVFLGVIIYRQAAGGRLKRGSSVLILMAAVFLIFSPHVFIVIYGGDIWDRMHLVMPLSQGSMLYMAFILFPDIKIKEMSGRAAAGIVSFALVLVFCRDVLFQLNYCNALYYTDEWVFQYEVQVLQKVYIDSQEARALNGLEDAFDNYLILGCPEIPYNQTAQIGNCLGRSFFEWDNVSMINREHILYLMRNQGYPLTVSFSESEEAAFYEYFEDYFGGLVDEMPCYPEPGYVRYLRNDELGLDYMVIKLGDEWRLPN